MADKNKMEEASNGNKNSPNKTLPKFETKPICKLLLDKTGLIAVTLMEATKTNNNIPPAINPATRKPLALVNSTSVFRFRNMITKRKSTMIALAYTIIFTMATNWALSNI